MNADTMVAVAVHDTTTRAELLEVAAVLLAYASVAEVVGHHQLRDRLVKRAAGCLEER
jgi:hypothetical protein